MRAAYSIGFWVWMAVSSAVFFALAVVLFLVTWPFDRNGRVLHLFTCFWAQSYFYVNPLWRLRVEGRQHLPWRGPAVLVSNHQSLGDILVLFALYRPFKWVSKESAFRIPFIGWNMRLNRYVPLRRGEKASALQAIRQCEAWLERGVPVLLFPEGTRSPDGEVKAFKDGAFRLAVDKGVPLIPIALQGTAATLPKHGYVLTQTSHCRVRVLPPIPPDRFGKDWEALRDHTRALIVEEARRLGPSTGSG